MRARESDRAGLLGIDLPEEEVPGDGLGSANRFSTLAPGAADPEEEGVERRRMLPVERPERSLVPALEEARCQLTVVGIGRGLQDPRLTRTPRKVARFSLPGKMGAFLVVPVRDRAPSAR